MLKRLFSNINMQMWCWTVDLPGKVLPFASQRRAVFQKTATSFKHPAGNYEDFLVPVCTKFFSKEVQDHLKNSPPAWRGLVFCSINIPRLLGEKSSLLSIIKENRQFSKCLSKRDLTMCRKGTVVARDKFFHYHCPWSSYLQFSVRWSLLQPLDVLRWSCKMMGGCQLCQSAASLPEQTASFFFLVNYSLYLLHLSLSRRETAKQEGEFECWTD